MQPVDTAGNAVRDNPPGTAAKGRFPADVAGGCGRRMWPADVAGDSGGLDDLADRVRR
jgi:hypothetical protein